MTIKLRGDTYWLDCQINGVRVRESLKTADKKQAQKAHDIRRGELWRERVLKEKPRKTFKDACTRWVLEKNHKRSLKDDQDKIDYLVPKIGNMQLSQLTRDKIESALPADLKASSRNRYRAFVRSVLRCAERDWEWLDRAPVFKLERENNQRTTFLTREQADALIEALPDHYAPAIRFALLTGLRRSNVLDLDWSAVDLGRGMVVVQADDAKAGKKILVPLNAGAKGLLESLEGRSGRVFRVYVTRSTWQAACEKIGLPGLRFHDLRHTWASWHAMAGTPLSVLQELGGWASLAMVQRYAHLSPEHLSAAAERVSL